jgi:hypothetical protein
MSKRWGVILPLLHVALSGTWIWQQNAMYWAYLPRLQQMEDFERSHPPTRAEKTEGEVGWDPISVNYFIPLETRAIMCINPIPAILAASPSPYNSVTFGMKPIFGRLLMSAISHLRVKARVMLSSSVFLALVGLQWRLIGLRLDRVLGGASFTKRLKSPALQITALAIAVEICCVLYKVTESSSRFETLRRTSEPIAILGCLIALFIWVCRGLIAAGRFIMGWRRRAHAPGNPGGENTNA